MQAGRVPEDALVWCEAVTGQDWQRAGDLEMYRSLRNDAAIAWQGHFLGGPPPLLTALLVGVQIRIWWFSWIPGVADHYVRRFTNFTPPALEDGEIWRLLSMGVLHTETFHIAMNMMWLAYTGWNIERALGRANLAVLYLASVVGGSLLSMFGSPEIRSLGASGGVFGLVAASVVFGFLRPELLPERGRRLFGAAMLPYLVLMFWSGLMNESTDNWSHFGGLLTGGALAMVLDPVPLQRRPGWNRAWQLGVVGGVVVLLGGMALFGPRIHPTPDSRVVRQALLHNPAPEVKGYEALLWPAPAGWRHGMNAAGDPAFLSPAGARSWAVVQRDERAPVTPSEVLTDWLAQLQRGWPDAHVEDPVPTEVAGRPGLQVRVELQPADGEPRVLEWRGTTRGIYSLQEIWEVEARRERRLTPLRDRLRAKVIWQDPEGLVNARRDLAALPRSRKARAAYADAVLRVGEVQEALRIRRELVEEQPQDRDAWRGLLHLLQWHPELPEAEALWTQALAEHPAPAVIAEVAQGLEAAGRADDARGLLDIGWAHSPGDRILNRARRNRDLPVALSAEHLPWDAVFHPITGARRPTSEQQARLDAPLTLQAASDRGRELAEEREALVQAALETVLTGSERGLIALLVLCHGQVPSPPEEAIEGLLDDLQRAIGGEAPRWMPEPLVIALEQRPEAVAALEALQADPGRLRRSVHP